MAKPNRGHAQGSLSSRTKEYSGSVGSLPNGVKTTGGTKGGMNSTPKAGTDYTKGKAA